MSRVLFRVPSARRLPGIRTARPASRQKVNPRPHTRPTPPTARKAAAESKDQARLTAADRDLKPGSAHASANWLSAPRGEDGDICLEVRTEPRGPPRTHVGSRVHSCVPAGSRRLRVTPPPCRFPAAAPHLSLALSTVLIPRLQSQTLLQQPQLRGRRHLLALLLRGRSLHGPDIDEQEVRHPQISPTIGWEDGKRACAKGAESAQGRGRFVIKGGA